MQTAEMTREQKQELFSAVAKQLDSLQDVRFLLARNFQGPENIGKAFRRYRNNGGKEILAIFKCGEYDGYAVVVTLGIPDFMKLPDMNLFPVRRDRANWRPRCWQNETGSPFTEGRNYRKYDVADNFHWPHISEVLELIEKDASIQLIYK